MASPQMNRTSSDDVQNSRGVRPSANCSLSCKILWLRIPRGRRFCDGSRSGFSCCSPACAIWGSFELDEPVREAVVQTQGKGWKKTDDFRFKTGVRKFGDWPWLMVAGGNGNRDLLEAEKA